MNRELSEFRNRPLAMLPQYAERLCSTLADQPITSVTMDEKHQPYIIANGETLPLNAAESLSAPSQAVAVVPMFGVLSTHGGYFSMSTARMSRNLRALDASPGIGAIVLQINSPGGTVSGTQEAGDALREITARGKTRTVSHVNDMMASAATWIGTASGEVVGSPSSEEGSVGIMAIYADMSEAWKNVGVKFDIARIPDKKARFTGVEPMTEEMRATVESDIADSYADFVAAMAANRNVPKGEVESRFGGGDMLSAKEAKSAGLIDRIATFDATLARLSSLKSVTNRRQANENRLRLAGA